MFKITTKTNSHKFTAGSESHHEHQDPVETSEADPGHDQAHHQGVWSLPGVTGQVGKAKLGLVPTARGILPLLNGSLDEPPSDASVGVGYGGEALEESAARTLAVAVSSWQSGRKVK